MELGPAGNNEPTFQQKVWIVCGITSLFVVLIGFFIMTFNVFLLILAGALFALFFHGFAELFERKFQFSPTASLLMSIFLTFVIILISFWFMGAKIQEQVTEMAKTLPATISNAKRQLSTTELGQKFLEKTTSADAYDRGYAFISKFFNSTFGVFT